MDITTGAMDSLLPKLAQLLREEYKLSKSAKEDVMILMRELESMHIALLKVAQMPRDQLDVQVRIWAADMRELSYDMEDDVDCIMVRSEPFFGMITDTFRKAMAKTQLSSVREKTQLSKLIIDMKKRIEEKAEQRDRYRIDGLIDSAVRYKVDSVVATPPPTMTVGPRPMALYKNEKVTDLIGIEGPRNELIQMLAEGSDISKNQRKILSIVGSGGLGKTALASMVYQELQAQFHCMAFVSIGLKPDMKKIFKEMAHLLGMENYGDIPDEEKLMDKIRGCLQNKRYGQT